MFDTLKRFLAIEPLQARTVDPFVEVPTLEQQLAVVQRQAARPWRVSSVTEALGVPAVFRAVTLVANTTGALAVECWRDGVAMAAAERPRITVRPNPFTTQRDFYRDTAYSLATRGEAWWWVAARDSADLAISLLPVNPSEVTVSENLADLRYPVIEWRGRKMRNEDMRQITYIKELGGLRGMGPLQACGAAVSVAVESQEWAANFFASGGYPSLVLQSDVELSETEAGALKAQWIETPSNMPKVTNPGLTLQEFGANPQGAQMLAARDFQVGDVARMFGIPGSLLDHQTPGSSLTYQNLEDEFTKFVRGALWIYYLEPIEQAMSDLLGRSITMKFDQDTLLRPDTKTRFEVYKLGVESGVLLPEEGRIAEGYEPGNMVNAPVPPAVPQAIPATIPSTRAAEFRCDGMTTIRRSGVTRIGTCGRLLSRTGVYVGRCPRCKKEHRIEPAIEVRAVPALIPPSVPPVASPAPEAPTAVPDMTIRELAELLPAAIVAAIPRPEPPVVNFNEGAFRAGDINLPPQAPERPKRIERDEHGLMLRLVNEE